MNATACSQTGCSGLEASAGAVPLRGSGCCNLALPGVYEQALTPFPVLILISFLQNLTHATTLYFAGEATDYFGHGGTIHGALDSGRRVALEIIRSFGRP